MLMQVYARAIKIKKDQIRPSLPFCCHANGSSNKNSVYPITAQMGIGIIKIEYGDWDTVSQLIALEIAQKL